MKHIHLYTTMKSPLGKIVLTSCGKSLTGVYTPEHHSYTKALNGKQNSEPFEEAIQQLSLYFEGKLHKFTVPFMAEGTTFQKQVWQALSNIDYGETKSYGEIAKLLKFPNASRAIGLANGRNPLSIIIPCHRVIGMNGKLTGYAGGLKAKEWLLNHEANFSNKK